MHLAICQSEQDKLACMVENVENLNISGCQVHSKKFDSILALYHVYAYNIYRLFAMISLLHLCIWNKKYQYLSTSPDIIVNVRGTHLNFKESTSRSPSFRSIAPSSSHTSYRPHPALYYQGRVVQYWQSRHRSAVGSRALLTAPPRVW